MKKTFFASSRQVPSQTNQLHRTLCSLCSLCTLILLTGCKTAETIAAGISEKSITGSGTVTHSRVGLNRDQQTPEIETLIVSGDYSSIREGEMIIRIEESEDASIFNSSAKSTRKKILISNPTPELLTLLNILPVSGSVTTP